MRAYGYSIEPTAEPLELTEVTLAISAGQAEKLASFFAHCALEMRKDPLWEHAHLQDFDSDIAELCDLVVFSSTSSATP